MDTNTTRRALLGALPVAAAAAAVALPAVAIASAPATDRRDWEAKLREYQQVWPQTVPSRRTGWRRRGAAKPNVMPSLM